MRADVVLGRTLVLDVPDGVPAQPGVAVPVRLDDGRTLEAQVSRVIVEQSPERREAPGKWLDPAPGRSVWRALDGSVGPEVEGLGRLVLVVELPLDAAGQGLWLAGRRLALNWLPDPIVVAGSLGEDAWQSPMPRALVDGALHAGTIGSDALNPTRRWRHLLLTAGLSPVPDPEGLKRRPAKIGELSLDVVPPELAFPHPALEALARQTEARWKVALGWLAQADPALARRVRERLCVLVDMGGGVVAPAFPDLASDVDEFLATLLDPGVRPRQRAERARAWLESLPAAAAWVVDDAGLLDAATGAPVVTLGVANLERRATLAWAGPSSGGTPELVPVRELAAATIVCAAPTEPPVGLRLDGGAVTAHVGEWSASMVVLSRALPARPPGLRLGPFFSDWWMTAWMQGTPVEADPAWGTAGQFRAADPSGSSGWVVYLECAAGADAASEGASAQEDRVTLWFGPIGAPTAIVRVTRAGVLTDDRRPGEALRAEVVERAGVWSCVVPVPGACVGADGRVWLGVERRDSRGERSAWPRPMLPWQLEPGRVLIDTAAWSGIPRPGGP